MNHGELLTRGTIWMALGLYTVGAAALLRQPARTSLARGRMAWTLGCVAFLAHMACAFTFYHHWSHAAAYDETARQTAEMTGFHWGGGLYLNYVFGALWLIAVLWWWIAPEAFWQRSRAVSNIWNSFFLFMIFNGTVVFGRGPVRIFGAALIAVLVALWWMQRRRAPL